MPLLTKTNDQFLSDIITSWASILLLSPNLQSGDPLLAIFQSLVLCGFLFTQAQAVAVNKLTRAATSVGADLDSWMADFSFPRIQPIFASGTVTFSLRFVSGSDILIPPGVVVQTSDGVIKYAVVADTNKPGWSAIDNAYKLVAGQLQIDCSVVAQVAGAASNVQIGALSGITSSNTGLNFVTNTAAIDNGQDAETDAAFRRRFQLFINAVNKRTTGAGILSAAFDTPGVVAVTLIENRDANDNPRPGYGLVVIDDGSGSPNSDLLAAVTANIEALSRPWTVQILVVPPVPVDVHISLNVKINPLAANPGSILHTVATAVINYVNTLSIGDTLYLENLSATAKNADSNVIAVQANSVKIDGHETDYVATNRNVVRTNNTICSIGTW